MSLRAPILKPALWTINPGVVAYNCQKAGMPHPVLAMPMWEGAGNRVMDYSGHGNHGTLMNGPTWGSGGIKLDGVNDYIHCINNPTLDITDKISVFASVLFTSSGAYPTICSKGYWGNSYSMMFQDTTRIPRLYVDAIGHHGTSVVPLDTTTSVGYTYGDGNKRTYVDGIIDLDMVSSGAIPTVAYSLYLFNDKSLTDYPFPGDANNIMIFNDIINAAQAKFISDNPYFMFQIPEELYGYVAGAPPTGNPFWYYNMLKRRNA